MMQFASTTVVETWRGTDLLQLGPIYPFVGTEFVLWVAGVVFWIGFHVLQAGIERRELEEDARAARDPHRLRRVFAEEAGEAINSTPAHLSQAPRAKPVIAGGEPA